MSLQKKRNKKSSGSDLNSYKKKFGERVGRNRLKKTVLVGVVVDPNWNGNCGEKQ